MRSKTGKSTAPSWWPCPIQAILLAKQSFHCLPSPHATSCARACSQARPAAAAAGLANIEILEREKIPEKVQETGKYFENTLRDLSDLDIVGEVRGSHFMMGIEFVADKQTKLAFEEDKNVALRLQQHAQKRGLIARPLGNILILSPTLILTNEDIDKIGSILRESIEAVTKELKNQ